MHSEQRYTGDRSMRRERSDATMTNSHSFNHQIVSSFQHIFRTCHGSVSCGASKVNILIDTETILRYLSHNKDSHNLQDESSQRLIIPARKLLYTIDNHREYDTHPSKAAVPRTTTTSHMFASTPKLWPARTSDCEKGADCAELHAHE